MCFLFCMPYGEKSDSILEQLFEIDSMNVSKMQNRKVFFLRCVFAQNLLIYVRVRKIFRMEISRQMVICM